MPVTPLHMGPGLAVKAVAGRHFSLTVFAITHVVIDIEPVVRILREDAVLHGFTHTYLGATIIAIFSALLGRPLGEYLLRFWKDDPASPFMNWLRGPPTITWTAAISGAFVGAYSHVFLDSIMHGDMRPLAPFADANTLYQAISVDSLHVLCLVAGAAGAVALGILYSMRKTRATQ